VNVPQYFLEWGESTALSGDRAKRTTTIECDPKQHVCQFSRVRKNNGLAQNVLKTQQLARTAWVHRARRARAGMHLFGAADARARLRRRLYNGDVLFHQTRLGLMLDSKQIDDLARRLAEQAPKGLKVLQEDLNRSFRATLEAGLSRLELISREEFDVQAAVLARTREKLTALEKQVAALEKATRMNAPGSPSTPPRSDPSV
jgi:BMFP domain-containing protein YqiC